VGLAYFFIHVRGRLPRLRYDCLISFCWKRILPVTLGRLILFFPLFIIFIN
jgi:NADH:ubiquinone oxidoreductase subunit H